MSNFIGHQNYLKEKGLPYCKRVGDEILCYQNEEVVKSFHCWADDYAETNAKNHCYMLSKPTKNVFVKGEGFKEVPNPDYKEPIN